MDSISRGFTSASQVTWPAQVAIVLPAVEDVYNSRSDVIVQRIDGLCAAQSARRLKRRDDQLEGFVDAEHVLSLCGQESEAGSRWVKTIVNDLRFLGSLQKDDVERVLKCCNLCEAILYIEQERIPDNLFDSCSPTTLYAKFKYSYKDSVASIVTTELVPGQSVEQVATSNLLSFVTVDPEFAKNNHFDGYAKYNLILMQKLLANPQMHCSSRGELAKLAKEIADFSLLLTREELEIIVEGDLRPRVTTDRYSNVVPYSKNNVETGVLGQDINGSYIKAANRLFIACQGPRKDTSFAFWQAVAFHGTKTVIALGPSTERQSEKFYDKYFIFDGELTLSDGTSIQKIGAESWTTWDIVVTVENVERNSSHCIIKRTFEVILPNGTKNRVQHLHCPTWQDMMGGDPRVLSELVQSIETTENPKIPIVIHCSAGIGRTGTLIAAADSNYQLTINPQKPIALLATIMQLRHQRYGAVQSLPQIEMLLNFIASKH